MSRTPLRIPVLAAGLAALLATSACAGKSDDADKSNGSSLAATAGFDPSTNTIKVGYITALTVAGAAGAGGHEQLAGQQAFWKQINADGGIDGKYKVKVVAGDNQLDPQLTVQAYNKMKDKVVMLTGLLGTSPVDAMLPVLERTGVTAVPSSQDSARRNEPALAPTFASYESDVVNGVDYAIESGRAKKSDVFCAAVQDEQDGVNRIDGLRYIAGKRGLRVAKVVKFAPTDTNLTAQIQQLKSAHCTLVVFGGGNTTLPIAVAESIQLHFSPTWVSEFYSVTPAMAKSPIASYLSKNFLLTGLAGNLDDTSIPGIKRLTEALGKTPTMQNVYGFLEGYAGEALLKQAIADGSLDPKSIRKALTEIKTVSFGGLSGDVKWGEPGKRVLPKKTTMFVYDPKKPGALRALKVNYQAKSNTASNF